MRAFGGAFCRYCFFYFFRTMRGVAMTTGTIDIAAGLAGRTAFVTGGLGGIGRATIEVLLAHGANVAFTYADGKERLEAAQKLVASMPDRLSSHPLDLRFFDSIDSSINSALEKWGRLDILVNNAAVGSATVAAYAEGSYAQDTAMMAINADAALKVCQLYIEKTRGQKYEAPQKIINLSSVGGGMQVFHKFRLSDGMSKAAVAFMSKSLAALYSHDNIDVFAICPGATRTKMFETSTLNPMTEEERKNFLATLPKQRLIEPVEIANLIAFLASQYSTPLHGAVIDASMGLGVRPGLMTEMD